MAALGQPADDARLIWVHSPGRGGQVLLIEPADGERLLLKLARHRHRSAALRHETRVLRALQCAKLAEFAGLVPKPVVAGAASGWYFAAQTALDGRSPAGAATGLSTPLLANALRAIGVLHRATKQPIVVGRRELQRWVGRRMRIVKALLAMDGHRSLAASADAIERDLRARLDGRAVATCLTHGDYWHKNVLVAGDSIVGVIDWDSAAYGELPSNDYFHFVLTARRWPDRTPWGQVVANVLTTGWSHAERDLFGIAMVPRPADAPEMLALYWLQCVEASRRRDPETTASRRWIRANVACVVEALN
ncbi:MAG: aminoglycoside phosphotransferase family protein [Chloroflexota bacterium]|nr:aminoglycoside phosphotransferase family protein [Chloroflexota bacterium]